MSELTENLDKLIQKAALDGALTPDAVAQFHALVIQGDAQAEELRELQKVNTEIIEKRDEYSRKLKIMLDDANELSTRAAAIDASEQEHRDREVRLECAELRVQDHREMFKVVFRNAIIRREVMTSNESHTDVNGASHNSFSMKDNVEEEET